MPVVGIDLGHCETAGAIPKETQDGYAVDHINAQDKDKIIVTQIVLTNEQMEKLKGKTSPTKSDIEALGEIKFGNTLPNSVADGEKFIYFKASPAHFDEVCASTEVGKRCGITHGMVMACFAYALVKSMMAHNPGSLEESDYEGAELFIGCPATGDWTEAGAREKYAEMIQRATGVKSVEIIPESRAAIFSSVENSMRNKNTSIRVSALNGAVVFDFGSSTADCTYMLLGRRLIEFSWTLGASAIEREMTASAYEEVQSFRSFEADPSSFVRSENDLRKAKEGYYNGQYGDEGYDMVCTFKTLDQASVKQPITVDEEMMNRVVREREISIICDSNTPKSGTWHELCREFFEAARDTLQRENLPIETIVLTGGASKMGFIYELCREVFRGVLPEENILVEANPSYTVANGLVWIARCDKEAEICKEAAKAEIMADESCKIDVLKKSISDAVYDVVCECINNRTAVWASGEDRKDTLKNLLDDLEAATQEAEFVEKINQVTQDKSDEWKEALLGKLKEAVNHQVARLYSNEVYEQFILPDDTWKDLQGTVLENSPLNVNTPLDKAILAAVSSKLLNGIKHAIIWLVAVMLVPMTAGLSLAAAAVVDLGTKDFLNNKIIAWQAGQERSYSARQDWMRKINKTLNDKKEKAEMVKGIDAELDNALNEFAGSYDATIDEVLKYAFEVVTLKRFGE